MRIIKNGESKLQDIHQFKCQICGCVYELNLCDEEVGECPFCHAHKGYQVKFNGDVKENIKAKTPDEVYPEGFYSFKDGLDKSDEEIRAVGIEWCIDQCKELKKAGVPNIHFYSNGQWPDIYEVAKAIY